MSTERSVLAELGDRNPVRVEDLAGSWDSEDAHDLLNDILTTSRHNSSVVDGPTFLPGNSRRRGAFRRVRLVLVTSVALAAVGAILLTVLSSPSVRRSVPGSAWRLVSSVSAPFRSLTPGAQADLQCVTDDVCYSPGSGSHENELFRTIDGGESWHETAPIPGVLQEGTYAFSCSNAMTCAVIDSPIRPLVGSLATLAITTDGGAHWSKSAVPSPSGISDAGVGKFACGDATHCVVSVSGSLSAGAADGGPSTQRVGTFLTTSDEGRTWTQARFAPAGPAASVWTMTCTPDGSCLAVSAMGEYPRLWIVGLSSHDWGRTWTAGPPAVYNDAAILYASCADATHCMLVPLAGPANAPYEIATTSDAGLTWQVTGPPAGWLNMPTAVSCATGDDCWIAMSKYDSGNPAGAYSSPVIEETHNGGTTWSSVSLPSSKPPISDVLTLSCPPSGDGCMGIGNLQDHFLSPIAPNGAPKRLSGPLVISDLPPAPS